VSAETACDHLGHDADAEQNEDESACELGGTFTEQAFFPEPFHHDSSLSVVRGDTDVRKAGSDDKWAR
jgi:hypothetical protein